MRTRCIFRMRLSLPASWARTSVAGLALAGLGFRLPPSLAVAQTTVAVRVLAADSDSPLVNAEVIDRSSGVRALTRETGVARVRVFPDRPLEIRVRQLGFAYVDLTLRHDRLTGDGRDTVVVRLNRVGFALPAVTTTAARDCPLLDAATAPLAYWSLEQLQEGAARYESFRRSYPFRVTNERRTSEQARPDARPRETRSTERNNSDAWGERYRPGQVVRFGSLGYSIPILFIANLGDAEFWAHHCVTAASVEDGPGGRRVRMHFTPSPSARGSDWQGDVFLDSMTSVLQRVEFSLRVNQRDGPRRLEGFTSFRSPSPLIVVPDTTAAMWWRTGPDRDGSWGPPAVVQLIRLDTLEFLGEAPPRVRNPR